jgi:hypothetical protein
MQVEDGQQQLFDLIADPGELRALDPGSQIGRMQRLNAKLQAFVEHAVTRRAGSWTRQQADLDDEDVLERLRGLGYIE